MWPFRPAGPRLTLGRLANGFQLSPQQITIRPEFVFAHEHLMAVSGMGKSKRIEGKCLSLAKQGIAFRLVDPQSETADAVLANLVAQGFFRDPTAWDRFRYVEFQDGDHVTPFNFLRQEHLTDDGIADDVVEAFHRCWPEPASGASQFDILVGNGVRVLLAQDPSLSLGALYEFILSPAYRQRLLQRVQSFGVQAYFQNFARLRQSEQADQSASTLRRLNLLMTAPVLEYGLGAQANHLPQRTFIDEGVSVLYSLGRIQNVQARRLLGCLLMVGYERAALSQLGTSQRRPHMLLIDEFSHFAATSSDALSTLLSEFRKVGLFVTMSHQTWGKLGDKLHGALQNTGVKTLMRVGREDAEVMARWFGTGTVDPMRIKSEAKTDNTQPIFYELGGQWEELIAHLVNLPKRHALVKVGEYPPVEVISPTIPEPKVDAAELAEVKAEYRRRLMRHKREIILPYQQPPAAPAQSRMTRCTRLAP